MKMKLMKERMIARTWRLTGFRMKGKGGLCLLLYATHHWLYDTIITNPNYMKIKEKKEKRKKSIEEHRLIQHIGCQIAHAHPMVGDIHVMEQYNEPLCTESPSVRFQKEWHDRDLFV